MGQGLASELSTGFTQLAMKKQQWVKLIGGVDKTNKASLHLLEKLGFVEQPLTDCSVIFYEYQLSQIQSS